MQNLLVTIGLPRSGKSTWAKQQNLPIVNRDSIRLALHGKPYLQEAEPMVTVLEDIMIKSLFLAGHEEIIIDATNTTKERRQRWEDSPYEVDYVVFPIAKAACIQRAKDSDREDLIPIIENMAKKIDYNI
jgi:predicted kinase